MITGDLPTYKLAPGAACPENYQPLTSSWEDCQAAAISLGFTGDSVSYVDYKYPWGAKRPQGCFRSTGNNRFHFNEGEGGIFEGTDAILCERKSVQQIPYGSGKCTTDSLW